MTLVPFAKRDILKPDASGQRDQRVLANSDGWCDVLLDSAWSVGIEAYLRAITVDIPSLLRAQSIALLLYQDTINPLAGSTQCGRAREHSCRTAAEGVVAKLKGID